MQSVEYRRGPASAILEKSVDRRNEHESGASNTASLTLAFESVSKSFGRTRALQGLTFSLNAGELFGFIGPNGSGKTTAIRHALGIYSPDQGQVRVLGQDPTQQLDKIGRSLAVMLDQPALADDLTAQQYLGVFCGLYGMPRMSAKARVEEVLDMIGLTDHRNNRLGTFSKGMRQRVAFGRCLLSVPRLLILDEPFDGIDNESRRNLLELLPKVVHELGAAALVASHNLGDIERVCDRIALINHGRVIASGTPCDLRENFGVMRKIKVTIRRRAGWDDAFIAGLAPDAVFNTETQQLEYDIDEALSSSEVIVKRLVDAGVPVTAVENSEPALEEMYFSLIEEDNAKCRG